MKTGALGYLLKGTSRKETVQPVKTGYDGEAIFGADSASRMMRYFHTSKLIQVKTMFSQLTERERVVLSLSPTATAATIRKLPVY